MPADPNIAIEKLLAVEGEGFIEDDHGRGPCKWGITLKTAQETHPDWTGDMIKTLTKEGAALFYTHDWWVRYHLYLLEDQTLADRMLNLTVNVGPGTGIKWLQQAVGVPDDEILGPVTAKTVNGMDAEIIWNAVCAKAKDHYQKLGPEYDDERAGLIKRADEA